jgi:hypothetical protein
VDLMIRPAELDDAAFMAPLANDADGGMPFHIETLQCLQGELGQGNFARHKAETVEGEVLGFHCRRI